MKKIGFSLMLGCVLQISLAAQPASTNTIAPAASLPVTVLARSASSRIWARIASVTNDAGQVSHVTNNAYTELASGLCYEKNGQWVDSVAQIDVDNVAGGASATQAPHNVHFANNANTAGGAIHLVTSDGKVFDSRVYGIAYWDIVSGSNVLLAPLQDCQGVIVGKNRVVYTNAFQGLNADLEYIVTKSGLEQNVILRERPPTPDSLGLDPATSRLQVLTEFFDPPAPVITSRLIDNVEDDAHLDFGPMFVGVGKAFMAQGQAAQDLPGTGIVQKHWTKVDGGRDFLIEEISYATVSQSLQTLPRHASAAPLAPAIKHLAALKPLLPREASRKGPSLPMRTAQAMPSQPGLVVDYITCNGGGPPGNVFQCDTTYFISGTVYTASPICFEGGAVIKFAPPSGGNYMSIVNGGAAPFNFAGSAYRPTVFTAWNDDSVGDTIAGSDGNPTPGNHISLQEDTSCPYAATVAHARFAYASIAYASGGSLGGFVFQDCQFVQCGFIAIALSANCSVHLLNDLFTGCGSVFGGGNNTTVDAENITADSIGAFSTLIRPLVAAASPTQSCPMSQIRIPSAKSRSTIPIKSMATPDCIKQLGTDITTWRRPRIVRPVRGI